MICKIHSGHFAQKKEIHVLNRMAEKRENTLELHATYFSLVGDLVNMSKK